MADSRIDELRRRLERDPDSRLFAQLAEELRKDGELEEAIRVARSGLERHPAYPSARLTVGRALLDSGDPAAARVELEAAVQGAPENILASRLLGEALETLGDLGSALDQYGRTLQMAPGDGHVESRIRAIQARLGAPGGGGGEGTPDTTEPMQAFDEGEDEDGEDLPPTIRIRMPGDSPRPGRAPLPPAAHASVEVTLPNRAAGDPGQTEAEVRGSDLPATLPMPGVETARGREPEEETTPEAAATEVPTVEPLSDPPPPGEGEGAADAGDSGAVASDLAPTLPKSRAAEFASADSALPPTLPPGVVTAVEDEDGAAPDPEDEVPDTVSVEEPPSAEEPVEPVEIPEAPAAETESPALSSATLAELYFEQGLLERAVEVYRQVLDEDPGNQGAQDRLSQIEKLVREGAAELSVPAEPDGEDPAARKRALERTIARLEALLEAVRRS